MKVARTVLNGESGSNAADLQNTDNMVVNKKNPFAWKAKQTGKKKSSGKRVGKSKPEKANNQLNRRVK